MKYFIAYVVLLFLASFSQNIDAQSCIDSTLIDPDMVCFEIWDPVCGCNGITYSNDCHATYTGGVVSFEPGECTGTKADCIDLGGVDFGECEMAMGVALVNGECQYVGGCGWEVNGQNYQPYFFDTFYACSFMCIEASNTPTFEGELQSLMIFPNPSDGSVSVTGIGANVEWEVYSFVGELFCTKQGPCKDLELPHGAWIVALDDGTKKRLIID